MSTCHYELVIIYSLSCSTYLIISSLKFGFSTKNVFWFSDYESNLIMQTLALWQYHDIFREFIFNFWTLEMPIESNSSKSWSLARKYQDQAEPIESKVAKWDEEVCDIEYHLFWIKIMSLEFWFTLICAILCSVAFKIQLNGRHRD